MRNAPCTLFLRSEDGTQLPCLGTSNTSVKKKEEGKNEKQEEEEDAKMMILDRVEPFQKSQV